MTDFRRLPGMIFGFWRACDAGLLLILAKLVPLEPFWKCYLAATSPVEGFLMLRTDSGSICLILRSQDGASE